MDQTDVGIFFDNALIRPFRFSWTLGKFSGQCALRIATESAGSSTAS